MSKDIYSEEHTIKIRSGLGSTETLVIDPNLTVEGTLTTSDIDSPSGTILNINTTDTNMNLKVPVDKRITLGSDDDSVTFEIINSGPRFVFTGDKDSNNGIVQIHNSSNDSTADGLNVKLGMVNPDNTNTFIKFDDKNDNTRGRIRGSNAGGTHFLQTDGSGEPTADVGSAGDVVYASGNADFGEWVSVGEISEWGLNDEQVKNLQDKFSFGLPEGYVVYVRNKAFYREAPGTPMVVTHSAVIAGNEKDENSIGEILSFIGQVPVIVEGKVSSGDFLIPTGSYFCTAKSPDQISFQEYLSVIGTAWEDKADDKEGRVLCAIGIKSICN